MDKTLLSKNLLFGPVMEEELRITGKFASSLLKFLLNCYDIYIKLPNEKIMYVWEVYYWGTIHHQTPKLSMFQGTKASSEDQFWVAAIVQKLSHCRLLWEVLLFVTNLF